MTDEAGEDARGPGDSNVADYKLILRRVLDNRPSGTRLKLAAALGKNRSFVTQITNPAYLVPIPAKHVAIIFDVCHLFTSDADYIPVIKAMQRVGKKVVVFGASGVIGLAATRHFASLPGWEAVGVSRRRSAPHSRGVRARQPSAPSVAWASGRRRRRRPCAC